MNAGKGELDSRLRGSDESGRPSGEGENDRATLDSRASGSDRKSRHSRAEPSTLGRNPVPCALRVAVRGVVQGVGFRPFVYKLAHAQQLAGWVRNTSWGVEIEAEGSPAALERFLHGLRDEAPPLARIEAIDVEHSTVSGHTSFQILESAPQVGSYQLISPDIATCPDCLREILDPHDRRYRYPFTNCTNCGPRFTIIDDVPYDRPRTTMRAFRMCPACQREYDDPLDRRFHAQPNACPVCGPQLTLRAADGRVLACADPLAEVADLLRAGNIVAIRGLGGYQLACDATNVAAVARLRERKHRPHKPFALMVADQDAVGAYTVPTQAERDLLTAPSAPIVLLLKRAGTAIAQNVAPANGYLGIMLPYTPLHHLLLREVGLPLVMTSGNLSEEPIARDNDEALRRLGSAPGRCAIADYFLTHNREIYSRYDDSVFIVTGEGPQPVRRARGYAPAPVKLPFATRPILACGPELKNTFCLTRDRYAFLSQHIGDMENLETLEHYQHTLELYKRLFRVEPEVVAVDLHPDYQATRYGLTQPGQHVAVQHHHAHLAACLTDNGYDGPAIGVIWDGTGYGLDERQSCRRIWGGEFLLGDARGFQRAAHLQYLPLPGGEGAIHHPARLAWAYTRALLGDVPGPWAWPPALRALPEQERRAVEQMLAQQINTPLTSSAGRLFDAVSALLGICRETSYEAQAAIELEMAAGWAATGGGPYEMAYPYEVVAVEGVQSWGTVAPYVTETLELRLAPLWVALLEDIARGTSVPCMARRLHVTVAAMIAGVCARLAAQTGLDHVALSGGCFQNRLLLALVPPLLRARGLEVLLHRQVPCNDGGVALGQAVVAHFQPAERL